MDLKNVKKYNKLNKCIEGHFGKNMRKEVGQECITLLPSQPCSMVMKRGH
jgi:hypothetical protein